MPDLQGAIVQLVGVLVGGAIGTFGSLGLAMLKQRHEKGALRIAVRASISSILEMYKMRQFNEILEQAVKDYQAGTLKTWPIFAGAGEVREDPILHRLGNKVGLLGDEAGDVVTFTNIITGIDWDLAAMTKGDLDHLETMQRAHMLQNDLDLWNKAEKLGQELVKRLVR